MGKSLAKAGLVCLLSLLFVLRGNAINVDWYCDPHNGTYSIFDLEYYELDWLTDGCPMDVLLARNPYHINVPQNIAAGQSMYAVFKTHCVGFNANKEFEVTATARNAQNLALASQSIKCKTKAWTADRILSIPMNTENINFTYRQNGNTKGKTVKFWIPMPVHLDASNQDFDTIVIVKESADLYIPVNTFFLENGTNSITITKNNGLNDGDFTIVRGTINPAKRCGINRNVVPAQSIYFTDTRLEANMFVVRFAPTAKGIRSCQFTISNGSQSKTITVSANAEASTLNANFTTEGNGAVKLYVNDDTEAITTSPYEFEEGDSLTFVAVANTGSHFVNWNDDETLTDDTYIVKSTEDVTVKANFAINTYNASFTTVGDGAVKLYVNDDPDAITTSPYIFEEGDSLTFVAVANTGSHFVNWNDDETLADETYIVNPSLI